MRRTFFFLLLILIIAPVAEPGARADDTSAASPLDVGIEVTSSAIPRGTPTFFTATFKLQGITKKDTDEVNKQVLALLTKHVQIQIDGHSENTSDDFAYIVPFSLSFADYENGDYEDAPFATSYSNYSGIVPSDAEIELQEGSDSENPLYRTEFTLTFQYSGAADGTDSPKKLMGTGNTITIKVRYDEETAKSFTITQSTAVANAAPAFALGKIHRGFTFTSDASASTIPTVDGTEAGTAIKPERVNIFAIKSNGGSQTIAGKIYNKDASAETDFDCQMSFSGETCQVTCGDQANVYVNKSELGSDWLQKTISYGKAADFSKDLEVGAIYGVFASYEPDGIIWRTGEEGSNCKALTITENKTMIEIATGKSSILGNPDCFVATAAYGSTLHPHLDELRWFRDHILMDFAAGRQFVEWYYVHGPRGAAFIRERPLVRAVVRVALWPLVGVSRILHAASAEGER